MSGQVNEVSLLVLVHLVSSELVQGLVCTESPYRLALVHVWQEQWACKYGLRDWWDQGSILRSGTKTWGLYVGFGECQK